MNYGFKTFKILNSSRNFGTKLDTMKWILPSTYKNPIYPFVRPSELDSASMSKHQVVIIGAGPTGLTSALDLASRGIPCVVVSKEKTVSIGSRAICFAKKTLEIVNRLDKKVSQRMLDKGVVWNVGKVFYDEEQVYEFNLLPEEGHKIPAFINLQQYYFEEYLVDAVHKNPLIDLRWHNEMIDFEEVEDGVLLEVKTPDGNYKMQAEYLLACDGVNSPTRKKLGIPYEGEQFEENFLIADITMENDFPTERWFWFDPPFNRGFSALLHKQPDGAWRIDLQLGRDIDKDKELDPDRIRERLRAMLGNDIQFELEWTSIYQFRCMRIENFVHNRIIFAGDAAHLVSPFGARGANGGVQDTDNLIWKLAYVLKGISPPTILNTYQTERSPATDENIYHSSNATDFISPKSEISTLFRNATLELAKKHHFAQKLVNSGRLSHPFRYLNSSLTTQDTDIWNCDVQPGYAISDVPVFLNPPESGQQAQLIDILGNDFTLIHLSETAEIYITGNNFTYIPLSPSTNKAFQEKYDCPEDGWYLIRPDHYIAARGRRFYDEHEATFYEKAFSRAIGKEGLDTSEQIVKDLQPKYEKDGLYRKLIKAHEGLSKEESDKLNAQLILKMMNEMDGKRLEKIFLSNSP